MNLLTLSLVVQLCLIYGMTGIFWPDKLKDCTILWFPFFPTLRMELASKNSWPSNPVPGSESRPLTSRTRKWEIMAEVQSRLAFAAVQLRPDVQPRGDIMKARHLAWLAGTLLALVVLYFVLWGK